MNLNPQILYFLLVLPVLFGATLIGDGLNKSVNEGKSGLINIIFGSLFILAAFLFYVLFKSV